MTSKILNVSIPQEFQSFLDENPDLSPSKMLQSKIIEIREHRNACNDCKKVQNLLKIQNKLFSYLERKGLTEEYMQNGNIN